MKGNLVFEHPDTRESVSNLGGLLQTQGKFRLEGVFFRRAVEGRERTLGPDHPETRESAINLRALLKDMVGKEK